MCFASPCNNKTQQFPLFQALVWFVHCCGTTTNHIWVAVSLDYIIIYTPSEYVFDASFLCRWTSLSPWQLYKHKGRPSRAPMLKSVFLSGDRSVFSAAEHAVVWWSSQPKTLRSHSLWVVLFRLHCFSPFPHRSASPPFKCRTTEE